MASGVRVVGAVLVGGQSRRMGRNKALVEVDGVAMAQRVASALLGGGCVEAVYVGGHVATLTSLPDPVIIDRFPGEGPFGGVVTALGHYSSESYRATRQPDAWPTHVFVVACDLPNLTGSVVQQLIAAVSAEFDVVAARGDRLEPAVALWNLQIGPRVEQLFAAGTRSLHDAFALLNVTEAPVDARTLTNVNRPDDIPRH